MATMKLVLLCACLLMFDAVESIRKKENEKNKEKGKKFREYCESAGNCKDEEAPGRRQKLKDDMVQIGANEADVEEALVKTLEAKKAMYKAYGVEEIDPVDDGTWSGDILLSPEQAQEIIDYYSVEKEDIPPPTPEGVEQGKAKKKEHNLKKRATGYDFNKYSSSPWPIPIPYFLDPTFTTDEKDLMTNALAAISSSSGCINFTELETDPGWNQEHIRLLRFEPICNPSYCTCGRSYVGKLYRKPTVCSITTDPNHPVCSDCIKLSGTAGTEYVDQIGKGEGLSDLDIVGLKGAYCGAAPAATCVDNYDSCPGWDSVYHICSDPQYAYIVPDCKKTCGQC